MSYLYIKMDPKKGRCVMSNRTFNPNTLILEDFVIPFAWEGLPPSNLDNYRMSWTDTHDCIALGYIQLLNHSDNPNVKIVDDFVAGTKMAISIRPIFPGDEITFRYKCDLWFSNTEGGSL